MYPSFLRTMAIPTFVRERGASTRLKRRAAPLRSRVRKSPIGSVIVMARSPGGLSHAGKLAPEREVPEADAAQAELPVRPAGPPADLAAVIGPRLELGSLRRLVPPGR